MEIVYSAVIGLARVLFRALGLRIAVEGDEHVPRQGAVIIASNHVSFLDFLLVGLVARRSGRRVRFLARYDVWLGPVGGLMRAMRHVPVDRAAPAGAYLEARGLLRQGEAVGVFPEAGVSTSYTVRALMRGPVALARDTGASIVPMAIWGPQRVLTAHRPVSLRRGRPVSLVAGAPITVLPDADLDAATRDLGAALQRLLDGLQDRPVHQPARGEAAPWHPAHLGGAAPTPEQARLEESVPRSAVSPTWRDRTS